MTDPNDKVPLFPKWRYWYALVIGFLIVLMILFELFTKTYS